MNPRKRLNHEAPYWVSSEADYFVTICAEPRRKNHFCHPDIGTAILDAARLYNEKHAWWCHLIMLMPDHIHMLVCFPRTRSCRKSWASGNARWHGSIKLHGNEITSTIACATTKTIFISRSIFSITQYVPGWYKIGRTGPISGCRRPPSSAAGTAAATHR